MANGFTAGQAEREGQGSRPLPRVNPGGTGPANPVFPKKLVSAWSVSDALL